MWIVQDWSEDCSLLITYEARLTSAAKNSSNTTWEATVCLYVQWSKHVQNCSDRHCPWQLDWQHVSTAGWSQSFWTGQDHLAIDSEYMMGDHPCGTCGQQHTMQGQMALDRCAVNAWPFKKVLQEHCHRVHIPGVVLWSSRGGNQTGLGCCYNRVGQDPLLLMRICNTAN